MERNDRIYNSHTDHPAWRKPRLGLDPPQYRWRGLAWVLVGCALVTGLIAWHLS